MLTVIPRKINKQEDFLRTRINHLRKVMITADIPQAALILKEIQRMNYTLYLHIVPTKRSFRLFEDLGTWNTQHESDFIYQ